MDASQYTAARRQLHVIAEWLLAGPQHAASGTIQLEAGDGSIATVADPPISVTAAGLSYDGSTQLVIDPASHDCVAAIVAFFEQGLTAATGPR
jgi:hypothetical protein